MPLLTPMSECPQCDAVGTIVDLGACCRVRAMIAKDCGADPDLFGYPNAALLAQVERVKREFMSGRSRK